MTLLDTHVHVWDPTLLDYPWLAGLDALNRQYLPRDIDRAETRVSQMIFVQADARPEQALDEVRWVASLAEEWPELVGIVGAADLRSQDLVAHLEALCSVGPIVGVRHLLQGQPAGIFSDTSFKAGLQMLAARDLSFDACVTHDQLPALTELLSSVPELRVVLDHLGKPPVKLEITSPGGRAWAQSIDALAALPRVHVKLSGLPSEAGSRTSLDKHAAAFISHTVAAFGPERSMLGSDWPLSSNAHVGSFASWIDRVQRAIRPDESAWAAISNKTGAEFYKLDRVVGWQSRLSSGK